MASVSSSNNFRHADNPAVIPVTGQRISGKVPEWLDGNLYRNGPGIQSVGPDMHQHLFDGLALLHRFHIQNGKVEYQNRYLESETYKRNMAAQRIIVSAFGTSRTVDPCKANLDKYKTEFSKEDDWKQDNCNVNVAFYGDQLYAMTETAFVRRIDPNSLLTINGRVRISDYVAVNGATAHPHVLEDGTILNLGSNFRHGKGPHYCVIQVPPTYGSTETSFKDAKIIAEIPCSNKMNPSYFHSFGMTTNYIIFVEQPLLINLPKIATHEERNSNPKECISWDYNQKTRIHVVPFSTGKPIPIIYETNNLFTFHHINAYEDVNHLIVDVVGFEDGEFVLNLTKENIKANTASNAIHGASARRYILPLNIPKDAAVGANLITLDGNLYGAKAKLSTQSTTEGGIPVVDLKPDHFTPHFVEFPRINYKYNGKPYNIFYALTASANKCNSEIFPETDTIIKYDIKQRKEYRWFREDILASEPVFIAKPGLKNPAEDDGVILSALLHLDNPKKISLLILDAKDLKELALVEFQTEGTIPTTFHGIWANEADKVKLY